MGYGKDARTNNEYRGDRYGVQPKYDSVHKRVRERRWMSYEAARSTTQQKSLAKSRNDYFRWHDSYKPVGIPKQPQNVFKEEWTSWNDFLGVENTFDGYDRKYKFFIEKGESRYVWREFWEAVKYVQSLRLGSKREYLKLHREGGIPKDIPMAPDQLALWKDKWSSVGWNGFLGKTLTTQLDAIKNVQQLLCVCSNAHYPPNMLEIIIAKEGIVSLEETLKSRSELQVMRTFVWEEHLIGRFHVMVDAMGSRQDGGVYLFHNVNAFMSELSNEFLIYRPT